LHLIAIAKAAGLKVTWDDFSQLSEVIPLICRVYPNGPADINHFHASGGMAFVIKTLLENEFLHEDVNTILGKGLIKYTREPKLKNGRIFYTDGPDKSINETILRDAKSPFQATGGLKVLNGTIGIAVIKTSAVDPLNHSVEADAIVFDDQDDLISAFNAGELNKNFIAVIPFQGPKQKGMPELHKLTPSLTILQKKGFKVGLVTDGRMSGASGRIPAAIHLSPEAANGGAIGKIKTGDRLILDAVNGRLECLASGFEKREARKIISDNSSHGRQLFNQLRGLISSSEEGAGIL
jgi:phosphogluconate dehydratase